MANKTIYLGDANGIARKASPIYFGDGNGVAREVKKIFYGDETGHAKLVYENGGFDDETQMLINACWDLTSVAPFGDVNLFRNDDDKNKYKSYGDGSYIFPLAIRRTLGTEGIYPVVSSVERCILIDLSNNQYHFYNGGIPLSENEFTELSGQSGNLFFASSFKRYLNGNLNYNISYLGTSSTSAQKRLSYFRTYNSFSDLNSALVNLIGTKHVKLYKGTIDNYVRLMPNNL